MSLCIPRKSLIPEPKKKQLYDERLYNNFKIYEPDSDHTCDLSKKVGRERDVAHYSYGKNHSLV